jgi:hypothetical protein
MSVELTPAFRITWPSLARRAEQPSFIDLDVILQTLSGIESALKVSLALHHLEEWMSLETPNAHIDEQELGGPPPL